MRPDRHVVTYSSKVSADSTSSASVQVELFTRNGTLAAGSMRVSWLNISSAEGPVAGLQAANASILPLESLSDVVRALVQSDMHRHDHAEILPHLMADFKQ